VAAFYDAPRGRAKHSEPRRGFPTATMSHVACAPAASVHRFLRPRRSTSDRRDVSKRSAKPNVRTSATSSSKVFAEHTQSHSEKTTTRRGALASVPLFALASAVGTCGVVTPGRADAFGGEIQLNDLRYETMQCPENQYLPNKKNTVCLKFTATATNTLRRSVEAANVFGFVEDAQGNSAVTVNPTGTSRTVLSGLDRPVPPGDSEISFVVTVFKDSLDLGALKLRGFKAEPSRSDIEKRFKPFDACEMDPGAEGCAGAL